MVKENSVILNEIDKARLKLSIEHYTKYFIGKRTCEISKEEALKVISLAVREFAMDRMYQTIARYNKVNSKRVYYLSIEYLIGRSAARLLRTDRTAEEQSAADFAFYNAAGVSSAETEPEEIAECHHHQYGEKRSGDSGYAGIQHCPCRQFEEDGFEAGRVCQTEDHCIGR